MKIIILAAGKGERLMPLTKNTPKPLLDMGNGNTLLEEQIERIQKSGVVDEIILVIGYLANQIEAKINTLPKGGVKIKTIYNPFYDMSNNLISLWLAKSEMDSDFMVTNGDNIFSYEVFKNLAKENKNGIFLSVSVKEEYNDDDMKVLIENNLVVRVSKLIESDNSNAESPGLALVHSEKTRRLFKENLELLIRDRSNINKFWLEVFNTMYEKGIQVRPWEFDGKTKWQEVDFHLDLNKARKLLRIKPMNKHRIVSKK